MESQRLARKVLLIGWDAADWKIINPLLDAGLMPNLSRLVDGGVIGNIATLQPCLSPILWTSIATGKTADKHGICGFVEPNPESSGLRLSTSTSRSTKAIWNILSQRGLKTHVIGWFASHPAEPIRGVCVSNRFDEEPPIDPKTPWPMSPRCVHPAEQSTAIADMRLHPGDLQFEEMAAFIPQLQHIDLKSDSRPFVLARALAHTASIHSIATSLMAEQPWDFLAVYYDALDVVGHDFMPYHPPRMTHVSPQDFALYANVINALYQFHDQMLGRLLELAGDDTTVVLVSDHGFHSDHRRPQGAPTGRTPEAQAAAWHRQFGVLAMCGPHIKKDDRVYGANLLDVTPTLLRLFGLPAGRDMDGRILVDAFSTSLSALEPIVSWDQEPGEEYLHPPEMRQDPYASATVIQRLVDLGYLPEVPDDVQKAVDIANAESQFNLAVVHQHHGRGGKAREMLEQLVAAHPGEPRYAVKLARVCFDLGIHDRARALIERLNAEGHRTADGDLVWIAILLKEGKLDDAMACILEAGQRYPASSGLQYFLGTTLLAQQHWAPAQNAFEKAIELDADFAQSYNGLSRALLMQNQFEEAGEAALRAVGLLYFFPQAHYHLGRALAEMGELQRAIRSIEIAVTQSPRFGEAHLELSRLYEQTGDPIKAIRHQRLSQGYADSV